MRQLSMIAVLLPALAMAHQLSGVMVAASGSTGRSPVTKPSTTKPTNASVTDSTIQTAVANATGKTIKFAPGRYELATPLSPTDDTTLTCDGLCEFVPAAGFKGAAVVVRAHRVTVAGLTFTRFSEAFDVNGSTGFTAQANRVLGATGHGLGVISGSSNVRILDNTIDSAAAISISLHDNTDAIVRGNIITNGGNDGITVRTLTSPISDMTVISNNVIDDVGKAGIKLTVEALYKPEVGMGSVAGAQNMRAVIEGNTIKKWGRQVAESAITIDNHLLSGEMNQVISVANNTMESENRPNELHYISAINVKDASVIGNIMRGGVSASGISVYRARYLTIIGNVVADACKRSSNGDTGGISLLTTDYSTVQGNTIRNPGQPSNHRPAIFVHQSQYNAIVGNVTVDDQPSHTMSYGIELSTAGVIKSDFNSLVGNVSTGQINGASSKPESSGMGELKKAY